jgi:hypothetical protein
MARTPSLYRIRRAFFKGLAYTNRKLLPKQWNRDLSRLPAWRKGLAAYRYWVTRNALD